MAINRGNGSISPSLVSSTGKPISSSAGDFVSISSPTRQANILIYGMEGTGKTTFCTRFAPEPVRVISLDGRADDCVFEAEQMGRDVKIAKFFMPIRAMNQTETKKAAQDLLDRINYNFEIAIQTARTVLVDTTKELQEICKLAFDGTMEKVKEHSHGEDGHFANRQIWKMANLARQQKRCHLIFTARMTEIWKDQKPTGRFKAECPKATAAAVDWAGQLRNKVKMGQVKKDEWELEITKAGTNNLELFEVYDSDMWDPFGGPFVYACMMNYKDSAPEDWK